NCADARYAYGTLCEGTPASALTKVHTVSITFVRLLTHAVPTASCFTGTKRQTPTGKCTDLSINRAMFLEVIPSICVFSAKSPIWRGFKDRRTKLRIKIVGLSTQDLLN
ncbi:hypothetical protein, partial [Aerosakkonema funiforme]|uniref:hypothetical protein n=1 Tax=Aerosakkonema funiforme TaxID=1246630 RepID=UPI001A7E5D5A